MLCYFYNTTQLFTMQRIEVSPYDTTIEFKEINHEDFTEYNFEDESKTIIEPNSLGYISDNLSQVIDLSKYDTTVINASVGQGKTTAVINFIDWYLKQDNKYKIVIITPFKSLNDAYSSKIEKEIGEDLCFDYRELESIKEFQNIESDFFEPMFSKPIQLISINSILGNPGTVSHKQSNVKKAYYEYLINQAKISQEKIVFIFDEVHESIGSFNPRFATTLFNWEAVVKKVIILSATFSESSKSVIKLFAHLTGKNLKILESKRVQQTNTLSELNLCFYNKYTFKKDDQFVKDLIQSEIKNVSTINMLCYSEALAVEMYNSSIGTLLIEHFGELNLCTGKSGNIFNHDACNIGTNFKTGVSIEKESSLFLVILPLKFAYEDSSSNKLGIFSDRLNSLIQGLARPRKKSKIYVLTPTPDKLIMPSRPMKKYIEKVSLGYLKFNNISSQEAYHSINHQTEYLQREFIERKNSVSDSIELVKNFDTGMQFEYDSFDWFVLSEGDSILSKSCDSYGKNLSNYIYWAAWNNQFVNCRLKSIIKVSTYKFSEGNIQSELDTFFNETIFRDSFFVLNSDKSCYNKIRNTLFSSNLLYKSSKEFKYSNIGSYRNSNFEQQLITFIQRKKIDFNFEFNKIIYPPNGSFLIYKNGKCLGKKKPLDIAISKNNYLKIAISHCMKVSEFSEHLSEDEMNLISAYNNLFRYRDIIINDYSMTNKKGQILIKTDSQFKFSNQHLIELKSITNSIIDNDYVLKSFGQKKMKTDKAIYSFLRRFLFEIEVTTKTENKKVIKYLRVVNLFEGLETSKYINLIFDIKDTWLNQSGTYLV